MSKYDYVNPFSEFEIFEESDEKHSAAWKLKKIVRSVFFVSVVIDGSTVKLR